MMVVNQSLWGSQATWRQRGKRKKWSVPQPYGSTFPPEFWNIVNNASLLNFFMSLELFLKLSFLSKETRN